MRSNVRTAVLALIFMTACGRPVVGDVCDPAAFQNHRQGCNIDLDHLELTCDAETRKCVLVRACQTDDECVPYTCNFNTCATSCARLPCSQAGFYCAPDLACRRRYVPPPGSLGPAGG